MSKRASLLRAFIFVSALGFTIYFALFERFLPPGLPQSVRGNGDHHLHALAFFCITIVLLFGYQSAARAAGLLLFVTVVAITLETLQIWLPDRGANLQDLVASLAGVGLGFIVVLALHKTLEWLRRPPR